MDDYLKYLVDHVAPQPTAGIFSERPANLDRIQKWLRNIVAYVDMEMLTKRKCLQHKFDISHPTLMHTISQQKPWEGVETIGRHCAIYNLTRENLLYLGLRAIGAVYFTNSGHPSD
ncbi:hypothetical protein KIN20_025161 [Parelaphostrongylus tenuis]|uniref:Uncharacterized protein n=1 Tax=Parelaphostrongylus tenuis TaxID=148309 RepID=A0AAD5QX58_PARTN|nr:hypothetical protein KIN20_025161 [Parelaphostrongylus tenuis]